MTRLTTKIFIVAAATTLSACSTWSYSNVDQPAASPGETNTTASKLNAAPAVISTPPSQIVVMEGDITDKPYDVVRDLVVTVNKTTVFHPDPTQALAEEKLRESASKIGADAVIYAEYDPVTISLFSWGSLEARGKAVKFK